ncbi:MAG: hypothetical protein KME32_09870 [Mojavia pulchra JT2-VF2]|jgi:hypothetical protein|uniref:Uncharacterized protein n=1 Tax=Mojavia pulchra JT2-VF2 TaxID=287848 RepID=A0A951PX74_9NOST|nr:hypothetical protein [Mojavia pulchra JT2-VF2]
MFWLNSGQAIAIIFLCLLGLNELDSSNLLTWGFGAEITRELVKNYDLKHNFCWAIAV